MKRHASETELALYAAGDLNQRAMRRVAHHVRDCEVCSASVAEFQAAREILAAAAGQPSPGDVLEVRQRVMSRVGAGPAIRFHWAWALAVTFGILISAWWLRPVHNVQPAYMQPVNPLALRPLPLLTQIPMRELIVPAMHLRRSRPPDRAGIRDVALLRDSKGEAMIRLQTADPNVVILLEGERTEAE